MSSSVSTNHGYPGYPLTAHSMGSSGLIPWESLGLFRARLMGESCLYITNLITSMYSTLTRGPGDS